MRVISGKYRGRKLMGPSGLEVRPTSDRLKESLFNILGPHIESSVILDAFGGTGAIGIEGLSRGAREAVFIENSAEGCRMIRKNLSLCGIENGFRIFQQDVFTALRFLARQEFKANIVFFDPPYQWKPYGDLLELVFLKKLLAEPSLAIVEHHRKAIIPESGNGYSRFRIVRQGDHCLSFYRHAENESQEDCIRGQV